MKHLKTYSKNESVLRHYNESIDLNIIQDLKDICLELSDEYFEVSVKHLCVGSGGYVHGRESKPRFGYVVSIRKPRKIFLLDRITEIKERLIDYMESEGYQCEIYVNNPFTDEDITLNELEKLKKYNQGISASSHYWENGYINRIKFVFE